MRGDRTFTNKEREEVVALHLKDEKLVKIAQRFGTSIPEIYKVVTAELRNTQNPFGSVE